MIYTLRACAQPRIGNSFHFTVTTCAFIKILTNKYIIMKSNIHYITVQNFKPLCISILEICVHKDMAFQQKQQSEKNTPKRNSRIKPTLIPVTHYLYYLVITTFQHHMFALLLSLGSVSCFFFFFFFFFLLFSLLCVHVLSWFLLACLPACNVFCLGWTETWIE